MLWDEWRIEDNNCREALAFCVNRVDDCTGWWCAVPTPVQKDDATTQDIFTKINSLFGSLEEAVTIFYTEAG